MKLANHAIKACTLSLILFGGAAISQTLSLADNIPQAQQSNQQSNIVIAANTYKPGINRVTFQSEGETLVGNLYLPANYKQGDKLPTVIVTGAWMTIKEQMPAIYAQKLAEQGLAAFAFDFRTFGESSGKLRNFESPNGKITDIKNAVGFLQTVDAVDSNKIAGLGICASAGYMTVAAAEDSRIKSLVTVAPWIHDTAILNTVYGGEIEVLATKKPYNNTYAGLFKFRDGKVALFREYYDLSSLSKHGEAQADLIKDLQQTLM